MRKWEWTLNNVGTLIAGRDIRWLTLPASSHRPSGDAANRNGFAAHANESCALVHSKDQ
jgi:hypothetical protein